MSVLFVFSSGSCTIPPCCFHQFGSVFPSSVWWWPWLTVTLQREPLGSSWEPLCMAGFSRVSSSSGQSSWDRAISSKGPKEQDLADTLSLHILPASPAVFSPSLQPSQPALVQLWCCYLPWLHLILQPKGWMVVTKLTKSSFGFYYFHVLAILNNVSNKVPLLEIPFVGPPVQYSRL